MSNGADRRKFEAAWLAANDDRTPDGQRAECFRYMAKMSQKYDTRAWKAELEAKHGAEQPPPPEPRAQQPAEPPPRQKQQQHQGESAGRQRQESEWTRQAREEWGEAFDEAYHWARANSQWEGREEWRRQERARQRSHSNEERREFHENVDDYARTGEWDREKWGTYSREWRPGGAGYHRRHAREQYRKHGGPPPRKEEPQPQYTQEQIDRAYGRIPRISYDRPQPIDLANDLRFALLMAAVAFFAVSIMMLAVGSWTLEYVVADPLAALGDVGSFIGFAWHRRDIVLQFCGGAAWILALRQISDGLRAAPGFLAWAVAGTILVVGGHLIGPPL